MKKLLFLVPLLLVGCNKDKEISHYTIPKETREVVRPTQQTQNQAPNLASQTEAFKQPTWEVPSHWETKPLGQLRKGSFGVKDGDKEIDISILVFPGDVGGTLANINRWAQQVGLSELTKESITQLDRLQVDGNEGIIIDLTGPEQGIYGVIVELEGHSWYFKIMGNSDIILQEKEAFKNFVESTKFN